MTPAQIAQAVERHQYGDRVPLFRVPARLVPAMQSRMGEGIAAALRSECPDLSPEHCGEFGKKAAVWAFDRSCEVTP